MSIHHMTRPQLIAKMERDQAAVDKAAAVLADNASLQAEVDRLKRELAAAVNKPARAVIEKVAGPVRTVEKRVEVPTPCPKQAAKLKDMRASERKMKAEIARLAEKANRPPRAKIKDVPGTVRTVTKEIPTPCPKQAEEIKALQRRLSEFEKYDMKRFRKWCKMVDIAEGKA